VRGGADRSYGVEVARLAGVPDQVITRARELLKMLEENRDGERPAAVSSGEEEQISLRELGTDEVVARLRAADINTLTPIEAMNLVYELKLLLENKRGPIVRGRIDNAKEIPCGDDKCRADSGMGILPALLHHLPVPARLDRPADD
jgi:hypothetical protein